MSNGRKSKVLNVIYDVIDQVNNVLSKDMQLEKFPDTVLIGPSGKLDSLGYINFIIAAESQISETFDISIDWTGQNVMLQSSLYSVDALADYICSILERNDK